ncbi:hypothetical protein [Nocardia nepalensis]|uniref:hypothetical protein n=1 Tax=Nocardia nepalensis TaxID=3375448 RepID=UPI003B66E971
MTSTPSSASGPDRVPVPARLTGATRARGLVVPHITLTHRDPARPVWGMLDPRRAWEILWGKRCQICGHRLEDRVVLFIRSIDYLRGLAVEPGAHPECAHYSRLACPMLAGQQHHYHANPAVRFAHCDDLDCECRYWQPRDPDPREPSRQGQPAEAWYEAWLHINDYRIIDDPGNEHAAPAVGVNLTGVRFLKLRKIRDATAPSGDQPPEPLAMLAALREVFGI